MLTFLNLIRKIKIILHFSNVVVCATNDHPTHLKIKCIGFVGLVYLFNFFSVFVIDLSGISSFK